MDVLLVDSTILNVFFSDPTVIPCFILKVWDSKEQATHPMGNEEDYQKYLKESQKHGHWFIEKELLESIDELLELKDSEEPKDTQKTSDFENSC